jgi:hypothetical protein
MSAVFINFDWDEKIAFREALKALGQLLPPDSQPRKTVTIEEKPQYLVFPKEIFQLIGIHLIGKDLIRLLSTCSMLYYAFPANSKVHLSENFPRKFLVLGGCV